ncbi:type II secretion system protein GspG [Marinicauda pacifica]|uniref:Type II secretion system core protein G n=1 Tax=Marinicauda pacifica TaxID=1133559 RepID=A0A4S2HBG0_9PROT|nr:type II secretion system major pseudopilin GspG [Marinicauda pacifica]TGY93103.1 type II secretion system protein GspG [Marinicauda pacifica]GGE42841.1 type II secretion system protein GspG [Marinicauda pacifica]
MSLRKLLTRKRKSERGVTLTEMMVVIVIIGLLSTIVVVNVLPLLGGAREDKVRADLATLEGSLTTFYATYGRYPSTDEGLEALVNPPEDDRVSARYAEEGFIQRLPDDPWGNAYQYLSPGEHGRFDVYSLGADGRPGGEGDNADIGNWEL